MEGEHRLSASYEHNPSREILDPRHFYAAYIFDDPASCGFDVGALIDEAHHLNLPVRYWWLSDVMDLGTDEQVAMPDRLIVCVHHPEGGENAGIALFEVLKENRIAYSELEAASPDEYIMVGKLARNAADLLYPDGSQLYAMPQEPEYVSLRDTEPVVVFNYGDAQLVAEEALGRPLSDAEVQAVARQLQGHVERMATLLVLRLGEHPALGRETETGDEMLYLSDYLVYYLLSGLTITQASSEQAASKSVAAQLQTLVDKSGGRGLTAQEANSVQFSHLDIAIESVEAIAFDSDDTP